ncbi:MAG: hypothetical protein UHS41_02920 [Lachnospiraceae bacterium]|nr:hypothetical protein [Lachnospiraceae bacterium]
MKILHKEFGSYLVFEDQGPDTRYRKRNFRIHIDEVEAYIQAYKNNFLRYQQLKAKGKQGEFHGEKKMIIRIGGLYEGVCLFGHYKPLKNKRQLEERIQKIRNYVNQTK